jgi:hypothetical protein
MLQDTRLKTLHAPGLALVQFCPKCKTSKIMAIEAIRPAIFYGSDVITFKCGNCGT